MQYETFNVDARSVGRIMGERGSRILESPLAITGSPQLDPFTLPFLGAQAILRQSGL